MRSAPISVIASVAGDAPVVSRSTTTNVTSDERRAEIVERLLPGRDRRRGRAPRRSPTAPARTGKWAPRSREGSEHLFVAKVCSYQPAGNRRPECRSRHGAPVTIARVSGTRYRCSACGNLTRFDVVGTRRTRAFHHYTIGGELTVEEEDVLEERDRAGDVPLVRRVGRLDRAGAGRGVGVSQTPSSCTTRRRWRGRSSKSMQTIRWNVPMHSSPSANGTVTDGPINAGPHVAVAVGVGVPLVVLPRRRRSARSCSITRARSALQPGSNSIIVTPHVECATNTVHNAVAEPGVGDGLLRVLGDVDRVVVAARVERRAPRCPALHASGVYEVESAGSQQMWGLGARRP